MTKYLHYFEALSAYTEARQSAYLEPWVSYTEGRGVDYNMGEEEKEQEYLHMPFTIEALSSGNVSWPNLYTSTAQYSTDGGETWETMTSATTIPVSAGDEVQILRSDYPSIYTPAGAISVTGNFNAKGNVMSLAYGSNYESEDTIVNAFDRLFSGATTLISAEHLQLPAKHINNNMGAYTSMFSGCVNMVKGPKEISLLESTGCTYGYACQSMFSGCTSLTNAPRLRMEIVGQYGCHQMFMGCTSLVNVPERLEAASVDYLGYGSMFYGCSSLVTAPEILATTFLSANTMSSMFFGCSSLANVQNELPCTSLTNSCYNSMFANCTSLVTAPILPATDTSAGSCYAYMFSGCTNLQYIKMLGLNWIGMNNTNHNTDYWVTGVGSTGVFVMNENADWLEYVDRYDFRNAGAGIPPGWTVETASV